MCICVETCGGRIQRICVCDCALLHVRVCVCVCVRLRQVTSFVISFGSNSRPQCSQRVRCHHVLTRSTHKDTLTLIYACAHTPTHTQTQTQTRTQTRTQTCTYTSIHIHSHAHTDIDTGTHPHTHTTIPLGCAWKYTHENNPNSVTPFLPPQHGAADSCCLPNYPLTPGGKWL